jgi:predicted Zn-dependent protease
MITRGMLNFAKSDTEVAYLIAREMAHNALGHAAKQRSNSVVGQQIDNLIRVNPDLSMLIGSAGIKPTPPDLDLAADNLSLYFLARAGFSLDAVSSFWQRLASQYPATVLNSHTALHPAHAARMTALEKSLKEIRAKQRAQKPLLP